MGWSYLVRLGSYVLRGRCVIWSVIYWYQHANSAGGRIADGNKWRIDSLEGFPTTFTSSDSKTTRTVRMADFS